VGMPGVHVINLGYGMQSHVNTCSGRHTIYLYSFQIITCFGNLMNMWYQCHYIFKIKEVCKYMSIDR